MAYSQAIRFLARMIPEKWTPVFGEDHRKGFSDDRLGRPAREDVAKGTGCLGRFCLLAISVVVLIGSRRPFA